jgi:hypothetical protein
MKLPTTVLEWYYQLTTICLIGYGVIFFSAIFLTLFSQGCVKSALAYHGCHILGFDTGLLVTFSGWAMILGFPVFILLALLGLVVSFIEQRTRKEQSENT